MLIHSSLSVKMKKKKQMNRRCPPGFSISKLGFRKLIKSWVFFLEGFDFKNFHFLEGFDFKNAKFSKGPFLEGFDFKKPKF